MRPELGSPVLELRGVRKTYGSHVAVESVDIELRKEEFMTFLGPSGSGKTTTLMLVAGLQQPDRGEIVLAGRSVERLPAYRRDVGMVFQHYALFPHMSVSRNVAFPLEMRRVAGPERNARVADALRLVGLAEYGDRLPRQLSGGQQQRVALARALVYGPSLLLMDEPLGALDKKLREQLQREIKRVHRESRASILYVTHDQEEALTMSDRIAVFNNGRIEQVGTPSELYERPVTRFVADFLGEMNFMPARVTGWSANVLHLDVLGATVRVASPTAFPIGTPVTVAVRPERVELRSPARLGELVGNVVDVVYLGSGRRLLVRMADGRDYVALQGVETFERQALSLGASVALAWEPARAVVFRE
jgi:putative spermidine/putrescine transport system ATP-binding protein